MAVYLNSSSKLKLCPGTKLCNLQESEVLAPNMGILFL